MYMYTVLAPSLSLSPHLQQSVDVKSLELEEVKDHSQMEKRKMNDMVGTLFREVNEASSLLGSKSEDRLRAVESSTDVSEEDFTRARIHLSNLRCEARTLKEQRDLLEGAEREARERAQTIMKELATCRLKISQVGGGCWQVFVTSRDLPTLVGSG